MNGGHYSEMTLIELKSCMRSEKYVVIDIRSPYEYERYHLPRSINIPEYELYKRLNELKTNKIYVFICQKGKNSKDVALTLADYGYTTVNLKDGLCGLMSE